MILNNGVDGLNMAFKFRVDGCDYVVFAFFDTMRCFECGKEGRAFKARLHRTGW